MVSVTKHAKSVLEAMIIKCLNNKKCKAGKY